MYIGRNSYEEQDCQFNTRKFKEVFKAYQDKTGLTQIDLINDMAEKFAVSDCTIKNWLNGTSPRNGIVSKDGKLNEKSPVVVIAKYFNIKVTDLLIFEKKEEKNMVEETTKNVIKMQNQEKKENFKLPKYEKTEIIKYNDIQKKILKELNDLIMDYLMYLEKPLEKYEDDKAIINGGEGFGFMFVNYHHLINDKLKYKGINIDNYNFLFNNYKKPNKEKEIAILKKKIEENEKNPNTLDGVLDKYRTRTYKEKLEDIDNWLIDKEKEEKKEIVLKYLYNTTDEQYVEYAEEENEANYPFYVVMYELEKARNLLRPEFINNIYNDIMPMYLDDAPYGDVIKECLRNEILKYC